MLDLLPLFGGGRGEAFNLLLTALAVDFALGIVPGLAKLVPDGLRLFSRAARGLDARLNRVGRSEANLIVRGLVVTLAAVALAVAAGLAVALAGGAFEYGWAVEFAALLLCISGRRVFADLRRGVRVLGSGSLEQGQALVAEWTGRDASRLDGFGIARVAVERAVVGFARRVAVPVFWFALLGFPGLFATRVVSRLATATAGRDLEARAFGAMALSLDHMLGLIPSLLAGWLVALGAAVVPRGAVRRGFQVMSIDAARDSIINDGRLKGAAAGALGLALGGPFGTKGGGGVRDAWIGNGRARVGQGDLRRTFYLVAVAMLMLLALVAALSALRL